MKIYSNPKTKSPAKDKKIHSAPGGTKNNFITLVVRILFYICGYITPSITSPSKSGEYFDSNTQSLHTILRNFLHANTLFLSTLLQCQHPASISFIM